MRTVSLSQTALLFNSLPVNALSPSQNITLTNTGNARVTITAITINGTDSGDFSQTNTCTASLTVGTNCTISVSFIPSAFGQRTASVTISDDATGGQQTVTLTGAGVLPLQRLSRDLFTNSTSQHQTEVEPDVYTAGSTIVAAFQAGRFFDGGSSDIGFATSIDAGTTWQSGFLPGITKAENSANPYDRASDPAVVYDAAAGTWLIVTLPLLNMAAGFTSPAVLVSRSSDGVNWNDPITVAIAQAGQDFDKTWITCDNWPSSPHYGNCYVEWDDFGHRNAILMSTSTDGGLTWQPAVKTANAAGGLGGQPVVQPNGTVIVPIDNPFETSLVAFNSNDGGVSWSAPTTITQITAAAEAGNLRSGPLPSARIDGSGKVYVVWQDCRFEKTCTANDLVMTTSTDGLTWSSPALIPIDPVGSGVDHFIPGLGVDITTSGSSAHLALTYYYYPQSNCSTSTCQLDAGFIESSDGGSTWSTPIQIAGPMKLTWLAATNQGYMVGDYMATAFAQGLAFPVFAFAQLPTDTPFDEAIFTEATGLSAAASGFGAHATHARPVSRQRTTTPELGAGSAAATPNAILRPKKIR